MDRTIKSMEEKYLVPAPELVETVFTEHSDAEEGKLVRSQVEEIRSKRWYLPAPECLMVKALIPGGLDDIHGQVAYADYECLR